ncbi:PAN domain-containing protein [Marinagarivorans cellulosilyticus]|uniref:Apple domain-containing protein n=1 Tax=Marinagarivorans cellulosilyticus TaxID=2721545 RepID=A0AAN2BJL8_9GAMM|nr:PAN domain-containing protein [Marinagarivorans cellulosilyticus]BCD97066.1 hypothetical protein MARGE09_P1266 [Marinagarivorans cellulosilyticus]
MRHFPQLVILISLLFGCTEKNSDNEALAREVLPLYKADFDSISTLARPEKLIHELTASGIIRKNLTIDTSLLHEISRSEPVIQHKGHEYSTSEMKLYSLAAALKLQADTNREYEVVFAANSDLSGGDLKEVRTSGGIDECKKVCMQEPKCHGFTFATKRHKNTAIHGKCWLKSRGYTFEESELYDSGLKGSKSPP